MGPGLNKDKTIFVLCTVFFFGLVLGLFSWFYFPDKVWMVIDSYLVLFSFIAFYTAFYKFKINQWRKTFDGKLFGLLTIISGSFFISQTVFVVVKFIYDIIKGQDIYQAILFNDAIRNITVFPRLISYGLGIFLIVILIKSYELETSWRKQFLWVLFASLIIFVTDHIAFVPLLRIHETVGTPFLAMIGSFFFPILNVIYLLVAASMFLFIKKIEELKIFQLIMGALALKSATDILFLNLIYTNNTSSIFALLLDYNNVVVQLLIIIAFLRYSFRYMPDKDLKKIKLNKRLQELLKHIRFNPHSTKTDLTRKLDVTRKTTDSYLKRLERKGLIKSTKQGREVLISISEKGVLYLNTIE